MKKTPNPTFLADWMSGKISDDELRQQISSEEFQDYKTLRDALDLLEPETADHDAGFARIKLKASKPSAKVIPLWRYISIAAAVLLFFGLFATMYFSSGVETVAGQTYIEALPDGSKVTVNESSSVCYPMLFSANRSLKLNGEAYFEVKKGSVFKVLTPYGKVRVLGTRFNVKASDGMFEVTCYEGKVAVDFNSKSVVLTPSKAVRIKSQTAELFSETETVPRWLAQESGFTATSLAEVFNAIESQYGVTVSYPSAVAAQKFTGSITHRNLETALKAVCIPHGLDFEVSANNVVITQ